MNLSDVANLPAIPSSAEAIERKRGFREEVAIALDGQLASDPCVEAVEAGLRGVNHYHSPANPPYWRSIPGSIPQLWLRRSVAERLMRVNARVEDLGVELFLFDAWRPASVQAYFHDVWFPEWLQQRRPDLQGDALMREVEMYWSAPSAGEASPAPHATGAAVDLTLVLRSTGHPLFMGGLFDDVTENAWTDAFERAAPASMSDEEARRNRRILYWAMSEEGFANNPTEWWHYSWGDQMWARLTGADAAHFGECVPEQTDRA
ncbi:MAG: M15 family metallopeptidase [Hyphomonadaceae bacterium]